MSGRAALRTSHIVVFMTMMWLLLVWRPVLPFDADDWTGLSQSPILLPEWGGFNPAKVLPGLAMPLAGRIAGFTLPITGDFVVATAIVTAVTVSLAVTLYIGAFHKLLLSVAKADEALSIFASIIFFLLHFVLLSKTSDGVSYLLYAPNFTWYYHYVIPQVLALALAMRIVEGAARSNETTGDEASLLGQALRVVARGILTYFVLFSNLFCSVVPVCACFANVVAGLDEACLRGEKAISALRKLIPEFATMLLWLVVLCFERSGDRATTMATGFSLAGTCSALGTLVDSLFALVPPHYAIMLVVVPVGLSLARRSEEKQDAMSLDKACFRLVLAGVSVLLFDFLLSAYMSATYLAEPIVSLGYLSLLFGTSIIVAVGHMGSGLAKLTVSALVMLAILGNAVLIAPRLNWANVLRVDAQVVLAIDNDLIRQLQEADELRHSEVELQGLRTLSWSA